MYNEIWKDVIGFELLYQVSNLGRVKSLSRIVDGKLNSKRVLLERILSDRDNGRGDKKSFKGTYWKYIP